MKRVLPSLILSLLVHSVVLATAVKWPGTERLSTLPDTCLVTVELFQQGESTPPKTRVTAKPKCAPAPKAIPKPMIQAPLPREEAPAAAPESDGARPAAEETASPGSPVSPDSEQDRTGGTIPPGPGNAPEVEAAFHEESASALIQEAVPLYNVNPAPPYPDVARQRGYQGTVIVDAQVNASGNVADVRLFQSSGFPLLDQAALRAVKEWIFRPGTREGRQVDMQVHVPVVFQLR